MKALHVIAFSLLVIGGINWGIIGLSTGYNLVEMILGNWPVAVKVVYVLVGLSAVYIGITHKNDCKICAGEMSM